MATRDLKSRGTSAGGKSAMPGYLWFISGIAIGLFVALLVYLDRQPQEEVSFKEAVIQELEKARADNKQASSQEATEDSQEPSSKPPRFDFYTILPELEVFIPESELRDIARDKPQQKVKPQASTESKNYLIQAGSFRTRKDAERRKANLALLGVQSSIQSVRIDSDTWHRVRIGPFSDAELLTDTLGILKQNNIQYLTTELR